MKLDNLLREDVGNPFDIREEDRDLFGVEIELEGRNVKIPPGNLIYKYWAQHEDHSLRVLKANAQATEYVLRNPFDFQYTVKALQMLFAYLNETPGVEVFDSYRTSIHVHVNCLNESLRTIVNYITLCVIFDELFVSQNGDTRIGNNFCLRTRDAEGQITELVSSIKSSGHIVFLNNSNRYSATNFASLIKFGTIEFRSLECTTDIDRVVHWIKTVQALKMAAREYDNPREIIAQFSRMGIHKFIRHNLQDCAYKYLNLPGYSQMMRDGMRLAQDFAYCSDWIATTVTETKPKTKISPKKWLIDPGQAPQPIPDVLNLAQYVMNNAE